MGDNISKFHVRYKLIHIDNIFFKVFIERILTNVAKILKTIYYFFVVRNYSYTLYKI